MIIAVACLFFWCLIDTCVMRSMADRIAWLEKQNTTCIDSWRKQVDLNDLVEKDLKRVEDRTR